MQRPFKQSLILIGGFVLLLWVIEIVNTLAGHSLNQWGILPSSSNPFPGILLSPLLHGSILHLALNTIPLAIMAGLISLSGATRLALVSLFIVLVGGLGVWWFGREAYHVGASGLIFGYLGYLVSHGLFTRRFANLAVSIIVFLTYGGLLFGALPRTGMVSWEAHLMGLVAGIAAAWFSAKFPPSQAAESTP